MQVSVEHNVPELISWLNEAEDIALDELSAGVWEAELLFERVVKEGTPVGVGGGAGLRGSIAAHLPRRVDNGVIGLVGTSAIHALPVELGTKPHFPPIAPLELWVQKKLGIEGPEAKGVAFAIAKTIAKRGTKGVKMFEKAFNSTEGSMQQILTDAVRRIADRLSEA